MTAPKRVLVIEDDPGLRGLFCRLMEKRGYRVLSAGSGREGLRRARAERPDLIVSDWVLGSGLQGVDVCARLKAEPDTRPIPIVVMTGARVDFQDELLALRRGADLYLHKDDIVGDAKRAARFLLYVESLLERPYSPGVKRASNAPSPGIEIDVATHSVRTPYETIFDLGARAFDVLVLLAVKYPRPVSRHFLVGRVWRNSVKDREVDVAISRLRDRLESHKVRFIESVLSKGWRLRAAPVVRS